MPDSKFITFDQVFDRKDIRKTIYEKVPDDKYYDVKLADPVVKETSKLVSNHINTLGKSIAQVKGVLGSQYYAIPVGDPPTSTK
jgi:hypothetical protein